METLDTVPCLVPGMTHSFIFVVAAFGSTVFRCEFCGCYEDVIEDSVP